MFFLCQPWLPARKHVPSSLLWVSQAKGFTGKDIAASKIAPKSTIYQELQGERFNCCEEGFRVLKKVQQVPGPSPKVDSAAVSGHHQYRACSGMAAGSCECFCMHSEAKTFGGCPGVKKGSKEATSLQDKHQGQTDILQRVQGLDC